MHSYEADVILKDINENDMELRELFDFKKRLGCIYHDIRRLNYREESSLLNKIR